MAAKISSIRFPEGARRLIEIEAARTGKTFSDVVIDAVAGALGEHRAEAPPAPLQPARERQEPAPKVARAKEALAVAEARQGVPRARLDTSSVTVYDGKKRPAYQKRQAGQGGPGKVRGR